MPLSSSLSALSPLDGRYQTQSRALAPFFSESALIAARVRVEIAWLVALSSLSDIPHVRGFSPAEQEFLRLLVQDFSEEEGARVKEIEAVTRHDVKAVEYWIKEKLAPSSLADISEWVHFACTSEDINNLAYALMIQGGLHQVWLPEARGLCDDVAVLARRWKALPMLARTHGQPASPTTVGKELAVFVLRWKRQLETVGKLECCGKINGAVGNWNAHAAAFPNVDWPSFARAFVESLGLAYNPLTTQIEPHDWMAEAAHALARFNSILVDFDRDVWSYISLGYFKQRPVEGEVGSSTMPHKVNPINFENSESNAELSNALLLHLAQKLPVSRLQRDLTDSSLQRNWGVAVGHSFVALQATRRGLRQLEANEQVLAGDLDANPEVLGEAVQTVMRKHGLPNPYEQLKELTRGKRLDLTALRTFIEALEIPAEDKARLHAMAPEDYTGLAAQLVDQLLGE
jgi:adenylosuccinate lyase